MNIIIANYGNDSIALVQWAFEQKLENVYVVYVDTGWSARTWPAHVHKCENWVTSLGFTPIHLKSNQSFAEMVQARGAFPTTKFQWCAGLLKGLTILNWLDELDLDLEAKVLIAHRRSSSRAKQHLAEYIEESEHWGDRTVWHPLFNMDLTTKNTLIKRSGFQIGHSRSLECDPCVNSDLEDLSRLGDSEMAQTESLELQIGQPMFPSLNQQTFKDIKIAVETAKNVSAKTKLTQTECFDMGCGSPYGCGL